MWGKQYHSDIFCTFMLRKKGLFLLQNYKKIVENFSGTFDFWSFWGSEK